MNYYVVLIVDITIIFISRCWFRDLIHITYIYIKVILKTVYFILISSRELSDYKRSSTHAKLSTGVQFDITMCSRCITTTDHSLKYETCRSKLE